MDDVTVGGDGPVVVLGHALTTDQRILNHQRQRLSTRYRVVTWDARGHGQRPSPDGPFSYADLARDLGALLRDQGATRAVVGGVSQGAFVALELALLEPELVAGLILISCQAGIEPPEVVPPQREAIAGWARDGLDPAFASWMATMNFGPDFPGNEEWLSYWAGRDGRCYVEAFEALFSRPDYTAALSSITAKAIVIRGEHDGWITDERARALAAGLRDGGELVTIAGASHVPTLTHPEATTAAIESFLDGLEPW